MIFYTFSFYYLSSNKSFSQALNSYQYKHMFKLVWHLRWTQTNFMEQPQIERQIAWFDFQPHLNHIFSSAWNNLSVWNILFFLLLHFFYNFNSCPVWMFLILVILFMDKNILMFLFYKVKFVTIQQLLPLPHTHLDIYCLHSI